MKKYIAIAIMLSFCLHIESAPLPAESSSWSYSLTELVMSRYYGTWVGGIFRHNAFSFTTIAARRKAGNGAFYVNSSIGRAIDAKEFDNATSDELDAEIGCAARFGGDGRQQVNMDLHLGYIGTTPLEILRDDIVSGVLTLDMPNIFRHEASPFPALEPYVTLIRSETAGHWPGSGWFAYGGFVSKVRLADRNLIRLDYRTAVALHKGIYGTGSGWVYHRIEAAMPLKADIWTITPAVVFQISANGQPVGRSFVDDSKVFWTLALNRPL